MNEGVISGNRRDYTYAAEMFKNAMELVPNNAQARRGYQAAVMADESTSNAEVTALVYKYFTGTR